MKWLCFALVLCGGCTQGSHQWYESANPQTSISVNPFTKSVSFFSNDGKTMRADKIAGAGTADGGWSFTMENIEILDRSVENRGANVEQIAAMGVTMAQIAEANWSGFRDALSAIISEALAPVRGAKVSGEVADTPLGSGKIEAKAGGG